MIYWPGSVEMEYSLKDMQMTCLFVVGKFPNMLPGLMQWALLTVDMVQ